MYDLLQSKYAIQAERKTRFDGMEAYVDDDEFIYIFLPAERKKAMMEQAALSYYLYENNYLHMARPLQTVGGDWFMTHQGKSYLLAKVEQMRQSQTTSAGHQLAEFHRLGATYPFEPKRLSSYGQWKQLWIDKLTMFENYLNQMAKEHPHHFYQLAIDILPYMIGISENAIAYIGESYHDMRYSEVDQGTMTFHRYQGQLQESIIWLTDLRYDHPARDLAEFIRREFLLNQEEKSQIITTFMTDYEQVNRLSIFSWQQLYARLAYPVHLFDCLEKGFLENNLDDSYVELVSLVEHQPMYEQELSQFLSLCRRGDSVLDIPQLQWL